MQEQERGERPELVGEKQERPEFEEAGSDAGWVEDGGGEDEGADGDEQGSGDEQAGERGGGARKDGEELADFGQVGERADVEADVHELEEDEEGADGARSGGWEFLRGGEEGHGCGFRFGCGGWTLVGGGCGGVLCEVLDGGDEAVAAAGEGFDEARVARLIAQGFADAVDGGVDAVVEVDEGAVGPEGAGYFIAGEDFVGSLEQHQQDLEGLDVELDADALLAQLAGGGVGLEDAEAIALRWGHGCECSGKYACKEEFRLRGVVRSRFR